MEPIEPIRTSSGEVLEEILAGSPGMAAALGDILGPPLANAPMLRGCLDDLGLVATYDSSRSSGSALSVDGAYALERTFGVDIAVALGCCVADSNPLPDQPAENFSHWKKVLSRDVENEHLARGAMALLELQQLRRGKAQVKLHDGSGVTPCLHINAMLGAQSPSIIAEAEELLSAMDTASDLRYFCSSPAIVSIPKFDTARDLTKTLERYSRSSFPGCDDKFLLSLLLQPGEFTVPQPVPEKPWSTLKVVAPVGTQVKDLYADLQNAIEPLTSQRIIFTYFRPDAASPAIRVELKAGMDADEIQMILATLASQAAGPFIAEPFLQYLADIKVKTVGVGLSSLLSAMQLDLTNSGTPELAAILARPYRTKGVS